MFGDFSEFLGRCFVTYKYSDDKDGVLERYTNKWTDRFFKKGKILKKKVAEKQMMNAKKTGRTRK